MNLSEEQQKELEKQKISDHLSNERTLLSWVRTSVGIMAFGFVLVEFPLLAKGLNSALEVEIQGNHYGYSAPIGISIVGIGTISLLFALFRYRRTKREINSGNFLHSDILLNLLVGFIFLISAGLLVYLILLL